MSITTDSQLLEPAVAHSIELNLHAALSLHPAQLLALLLNRCAPAQTGNQLIFPHP